MTAEVPLHLLRAGMRCRTPWGFATVLPDFDFEARSAAGYVWSSVTQRWTPPDGAQKPGLSAVGTAVYAEHEATEVTHLSYDLKRGAGPVTWLPGMPPPADLLAHLAAFDPAETPSYEQPGLIEAHNSFFEYMVWNEVLHKRHGWPRLHLRQLRCSMSKARAYSMPGGLDKLSKVLKSTPKNPAGDALLKKYAVPRQPLKADGPNPDPAKLWRVPTEADAAALIQYNVDDIIAEADASRRLPDLIPTELEYWLADQECNARGMGVDVETAVAAGKIIRQAQAKYDGELHALTGGRVARGSEVANLKAWAAETFGVRMDDADDETVSGLLDRDDTPPPLRRALEIRQLVGSASVKKVFAMSRMATRDGRLRNLYNFHGARTGRDTHADVQPGNLPKAGPKLRWCEDAECGRPYGQALQCCPWCGASAAFSRQADWSFGAVVHAVEIIRHADLELLEYFFCDAFLTICGVIRPLLQAAPGHELICSDYSSIEAVVTAVISGEQWRIDAFARREDIYLHGAAGITGLTYEFYKQWAVDHNGKKHPDRQDLGKPGELGLGFGGWINAWLQFGGKGTEAEIRENILKWRARSPMVVEMWGGQFRGTPWKPISKEFYGLEGIAIQAVLNPGREFCYRGIGYQVLDNVLFCRLPSGRRLTYHAPSLELSSRREGWVEQYSLKFWGWNSNPKMGAIGWIQIETFGGRLFENVVQAVARDIMAHAVINLGKRGYPVVLRVHDELAVEVPTGTGSVEEVEAIMADLPHWAKGWPIRAAGGWRGVRYRKEDD